MRVLNYPAPSTLVPNRPQEVRFEQGEVVFREGDLALHWYEVMSGIVRTCRYAFDGARHLTAFLYPSEVFGLDESLYAETAEAVTAVTLTKRERAWLPIDPNAGPKAFQKALGTARESIFLLGRRTAAERVAAFLLLLARRHTAVSDFVVPMCRNDIADYLGLTVHTVSRTISDLARRKLITLRGAHSMQIRDHEGLRHLAGLSESETILIEPRPAAGQPR